MSRLRKIFKDDVEEVVRDLKKAEKARLVLLYVLEDIEKGIYCPPLDDVNWAVKRAYKDGQHSIVNELKTLLTMEK